VYEADLLVLIFPFQLLVGVATPGHNQGRNIIMTKVLSSDDAGSQGLGPDPDIRIQALGPAILVPSQTIGNVVARTNDLLAGHREWLNTLSQRAERSQHHKRAQVAPASKSHSILGKRKALPHQPQYLNIKLTSQA
jgi:hypothetical protein